MNSFSKIRSFSEIGWDDFQNNILKAIDKEINNCNDDYILNVCEEKYITYLVEKFTFEPLDILSETEEVGTPVEIRQDLSEYQNRGAFSRFGYYRNGYMHIPADTRSAFPVISVHSPVSIQCRWQS